MRYFYPFVKADLKKKMVFISGPRQVGKTTLGLKYLRDTDKREIDFIVVKNKKPLFAVECKSNDTALSPHLDYFQKRLKIPKCFQVHLKKKDFGDNKGRLLPYLTFCKEILKI